MKFSVSFSIDLRYIANKLPSIFPVGKYNGALISGIEIGFGIDVCNPIASWWYWIPLYQRFYQTLRWLCFVASFRPLYW
jgi:hypothetical protein